MPHHIFSHKYRHMTSPIVNRKSQSYHFGNNHRSPGPRFDHLFSGQVLLSYDFVQKMKIYPWSFFNRSTHTLYPYLHTTALNNKTIRPFIFTSNFSFGWLTPRSAGMSTPFCSTFTPSMRMVYRIHRSSSIMRHAP